MLSGMEMTSAGRPSFRAFTRSRAALALNLRLMRTKVAGSIVTMFAIEPVRDTTVCPNFPPVCMLLPNGIWLAHSTSSSSLSVLKGNRFNRLRWVGAG